MSHETSAPARSFGAVADAYDRGRPTYPREAAVWLTAETPCSVLELGAGTGKLTEQLVALGHDVHATDPDADMLARLQQRLPDVRTSQASAEEIPAGDRTYDVVVSAQAFHWFDHDRALPEIARVLRSAGRLSLVWNERDERVPWVRKLGDLIGRQDQLRDPADVVGRSRFFGDLETAEFRHRQHVDRYSIQDLVLSRSNVATLPPVQREAKLAEVVAFYDDYGRGMDGMQLPYTTRCFRTRVGDIASRPAPRRETADAGGDPAVQDAETGASGASGSSGSSGASGASRDSDDLLLIDFR